MEVNVRKFSSELLLRDLFFESVSCLRKNEISDGQLEINLKSDHIVTDKDESTEQFRVELLVEISNENKSLKINLTLVGLFECNFANCDQEFRNQMIKKNTVAIMFPYLRAQVSLITTQPNMTPVVIPPINVNALVEETEQSL